MRGGWGFEGSCGALVRGAVDGYAADVLRLRHGRVSVGHHDSVAAHRQDQREEVIVFRLRRKDLGGLRPIASLRALEYVCYAGTSQGHAPFCAVPVTVHVQIGVAASVPGPDHQDVSVERER